MIWFRVKKEKKRKKVTISGKKEKVIQRIRYISSDTRKK